ncbi:MAG: hypothetical protein M1834_003083 [Cirrosporium novae-zelandiae]|nr:MAG: hypothetical protein M1834_003083 [Cirrosporium novae-zelandiae]
MEPPHLLDTVSPSVTCSEIHPNKDGPSTSDISEESEYNMKNPVIDPSSTLSSSPFSYMLPQHSFDATLSRSVLSKAFSAERRESRESFSSIKEEKGSLAQTFRERRQSSKLGTTSIGVQTDSNEMGAPQCDDESNVLCTCGRMSKWKHVLLRGKRLSKSTDDLRIFGNYAVKPNMDLNQMTPPQELSPVIPTPKRSKFYELPQEVLEQIASYLSTDIPAEGNSYRNVDLVACLLTCRDLHSAVLPVLYSHMTIPHSYIFSKALSHIKNYPTLGTFVKRLDFCHFTSVGLGRTKHMNSEIQNLTSKTLVQFLELAPNLREFLAQEQLEDDLNADVLQILFNGLPMLRAVDLCSCSSPPFETAFTTMLENPSLPLTLGIQRISLHDCTILPASDFEILLPRLPNLTHLDVAHTQISEKALFSIPATARLTHLNLARCMWLDGSGVTQFLTQHPAVKDSLVYLNLLCDISRYRLLHSADVAVLLPHLPRTLRSLNLTGAYVTSEHLPALVPLTKHLEELGLGYTALSINDICAFFPLVSSLDDDDDDTDPSTTIPTTTTTEPSTLHYLDLTFLPTLTRTTLFSTLLFMHNVFPLEVIELSESLIRELKQSTGTNKLVGWTVRELGRRGWYVRVKDSQDGKVGMKRVGNNNNDDDDACREWKMGARWWGMRKVNVARGEVGGVYGHFMFKK